MMLPEEFSVKIGLYCVAAYLIGDPVRQKLGKSVLEEGFYLRQSKSGGCCENVNKCGVKVCGRSVIIAVVMTERSPGIFITECPYNVNKASDLRYLILDLPR